jgi:tetratricopeptide (TPR) repeat protein
MMTDTFQAIIDAVKKQEYHHAENLCWSALKSQPNSSLIQKWLGIALLQQKKYEGALDALLRSLPDYKNDFDVINNIAFAYRHLEDYANAIIYLDEAEKIKPNQYAVAFNRANISFNLKNYDVAFDFANRCFELIKDIPGDGLASDKNLISLYLEILIARNNTDETINFIKKELEKKFDARMFFDLSNNVPQEITEKIKIQAQDFALNEENYFLSRAAAFLGLGRIHEKEKKYKDAFVNYEKGNSIKAEKLRYKPFAAQEFIKKTTKYFNKNFYLNMYENFDEKYSERGKNCIFIVGNPRSGTTLLESILGSSDKIVSAGELQIFNRLSQFNYDDIIPEKALEIGNEYLRILKNFNPDNDHQFVIDKLPANIYNVGLIKLCLPSAKIICLNRRPLDNAWSIFTQFYLANIPYSSNLFNLGIALSNVEALKKLWLSQNDNGNFLLMDYEKIVSDPQKYAKEIYNFIGINELYDEEKRKKFSSGTASKTQIKKDIYTSSISRSKDYDIFLAEFEKSYKNQNAYWDKYLKDQKVL